MLKKSNKKGFTLAELLIVVAIIAVLTAIAVPLFVSSVNRAQETTFEANKSAVKSAHDTFNVNDEFNEGGALYFTADVDKNNGTISNITRAKKDTAKETTDYAEWQESGKITVSITKTDIEKIGDAPTE